MTTTSSESVGDSPARTAQRHRLGGLLLLFLVVTAAASVAMVALQNLLGVPRDVFQFTTLSTVFGALAVGLRAGWRPPAPPARRFRLLPGVLVAINLAALYLVTLAGVARYAGHPLTEWPALAASLPVFLAVQFIGAGAEEIGWRGVVQPMFETRMPVLVAAAVSGALFGLGHYHLLAAGLLDYLLFVLSATCIGIALVAVGHRMSFWHRVLTATILHWMINLVQLCLPPQDSTSMLLVTAAAAAAMALAAVLLIRSRDRDHPSVEQAGHPAQSGAFTG